MKQKLWTLARIAIGASLLYLVFSRTRNWGAARLLISTVWLFPLLGLQTLLGTAVESKRLGMLFRSQGIDVPFGFGYRLCAVATFFSLCIPGGTGGDMMKFYYLGPRARGKNLEVATVVLLDRMVGMFALLCLTVSFALVQNSLIRDYPAIRLLIGCAGALIVALPCFSIWIASARFRSGRWYRLSRHTARVSDAIYAFRDHKAALAGGVGISICGDLGMAFMFAAAGTVVLPEAPSMMVCTLAFLGMFANALPITPGGLGVGESAFQALFAIAGFQGGAPLMLAWRIGMLFPALAGCLFYMRGIHKAQPEAIPVYAVAEDAG